jgi:ubiquinone/menaquinone biosynthesis C-methylase UbiE
MPGGETDLGLGVGLEHSGAMSLATSSRDIAAAWDSIWSNHPYRFARVRSIRAKLKVAAAIAVGMKFQAHDRVLDLACGTGDNLLEAARQTPNAVRFFALDISGVALARARSNLEQAHLKLRLIRADWGRLPFRNCSFDKVIAFMAPFPTVIGEIERVLAPGGELFMIALSRDSIISTFYRIRESLTHGPFDEGRNYSARQLINMLERFFIVEEWRILHSGGDRLWSSTVDRLIARWSTDWGRYIVVRCTKSG